jgi:hypothetical protein
VALLWPYIFGLVLKLFYCCFWWIKNICIHIPAYLPHMDIPFIREMKSKECGWSITAGFCDPFASNEMTLNNRFITSLHRVLLHRQILTQMLIKFRLLCAPTMITRTGHWALIMSHLNTVHTQMFYFNDTTLPIKNNKTRLIYNPKFNVTQSYALVLDRHLHHQ